MPLKSPFTSRSLASNGITYAVPPGKGLGSAITSGVKDIAGVFNQIGAGKVRGAQAGYYEAQSENARAEAYEHTQTGDTKAAAIARQAAKDRDFADAAAQPATPEGLRRREEILAPYYGDQYGAPGIRASMMDAAAIDAAMPGATPTAPTGTPFTRNVLSTFMAADGHALKDNEALTDADNTQRFVATDAEKRADFASRDAANRYGSDQQLKGTLGSAGISAAAGERNNIRTNTTSRFNNAYTASMDYQKPGAGGGPSTETKKEYGSDPTKPIRTTVTDKVPLHAPPPKFPPGTPSGPVQPLPQGITRADVIAQAKAAAAQGRDTAGIKAKMQAWGINPAEAGL